MAEFTEVMKQKERMCNYYEDIRNTDVSCRNCNMNLRNNGIQETCSSLMDNFPEKAEQIIMDWAKEHPTKTNADKFEEVFGFELDMVEISEVTNGCILKCGETKFCEECVKYNFWSREYKEPKEV